MGEAKETLANARGQFRAAPAETRDDAVNGRHIASQARAHEAPTGQGAKERGRKLRRVGAKRVLNAALAIVTEEKLLRSKRPMRRCFDWRNPAFQRCPQKKRV